MDRPESALKRPSAVLVTAVRTPVAAFRMVTAAPPEGRPPASRTVPTTAASAARAPA